MGPKRGGGGGGRKNNISYIKPEEPAFLRRIKQQAGYTAAPDVDTKREAYSEDSDEEGVEERDDEKPQVVVLKSGDLTQEEALVAEKLQKERDERELIESGKITFKPTNKRSKTEPQDTDASNKKAKTESSKKKDAKKKSSLLSFEENDE